MAGAATVTRARRIGFRNAVQRFPDEDLTVALLTNRNELAAGLLDSLVAAVRERRP